MNTFVLSPQTADLPVRDLLNQAANGGLTVLDTEGNVVAYVLSPADREELIYAQAKLDLELHRDEVEAARKRRGGVTTKELLERARAAAERHEQPS
jgi:hypothetical protein